MSNKTSLQMVFLTDQNKKVRITIPTPKQPIDSAAVNNAMDLIVSRNVFAFPQGVIINKVSADEIQTDTSTVS